MQPAPAPPMGMVPPSLQADYGGIRSLPIFAGVPDHELAMAMSQGGISQRRLDRDLFIGEPISGMRNGPAPVVYVMQGQIAAAVFTEGDLQERRNRQQRLENASAEELESESLLKPPPLARTAQKNVALFMPGDLFNLGVMSMGRGMPVAFYTAAPCTYVSIDQRWIAELASRYPFFEQRLRRALASSRERLAWLSGVKQELLDFFVRQGLSVSGEMVRVRQLGLCIDCKLCEIACEERYGAQRLTLGGYQLGMLDFVYTCRTCSDQRCIDPCAYDSIRFDPVKKEVIINESSCTGCTACAQACPYGAIDMVEIENDSPAYKKDFKARLEKKKALTFGPGTPRQARARRIANKCDHCAAYGDQACVSACPTGALIEMNAFDLFRERSRAMTKASAVGFEIDPAKAKRRDRGEVLPVTPFTDGVVVRTGGLAKVKRGRYAPLLFWALGLLVFMLALGEVLLRKYWPEMSYLFSQLRANPEFADLPESAVLSKVGFRAGDQLSVWSGVGGTGLMIIAAIYPVFRRIKLFRWMASNTMWFDFHLMAGCIGPMLVGLHSALQLDSWVSAAFWSMVIVVISGFLGRYLYTQVPELSSGVELEELDHERKFQQARMHLPMAMSAIDRELGAHRARADKVARSPGVWRALFWLVLEDMKRGFRRRALGSTLKKLRAERFDARVRRDLVKRAGRMILIGRSRVVAPKAQLLLNSWKKVHVPFTIILTGFAAVHIYISWSRAW
ncbi:MAG: 4Fe-4S dicluster domain-containing protein [Kofleriaceae bacterium]